VVSGLLLSQHGIWELHLPTYLQHLRTDPQYYARTPEQQLDRAACIVKIFDAKAAQFFSHLPSARFAIWPLPDDLATIHT
jgi:uncharacterized protein (DUF885 family)